MSETKMNIFQKDKQYIKFCAYGFLKNLRFYDAFLLLFFLENGVSYSQIGILYAAREIIINVFEIPSGIIADTYGRKNSLILALLFYILSFFIFYLSTGFSLLLIAIILNGIGDAFRSGTHKGMIMDYLKINQWSHHKVVYYGHTRSWSQKGSALSALFAGFLVLYSGSYRLIYLFAIVPYVLNFINIYTYPNVLNFSLKKKNLTSKNEKRGGVSLVSVFQDFMITIKNRQVFEIINSAALHSSFLKALKDYIQPIMLQIAVILPVMSTLDIKRKSGLVIGLIYFCIFLLTSYASKNVAKVTRLNIQNISTLTLLIGLGSGLVCGFFMIYDLWVFSLLFFIVIYLIENVRKPILTGALADNVPNKILTSVLSAQSFYGTLLTSSIAISFGVIADQFGIEYSLLTVSGGLILLVLLISNYNSHN